MDLAVITVIYSTVGWLGWIVIGGIAGALAGLVMRGGGFGILSDIIVGIVGGFILGLFVNTAVGVWGSFVTAFIGACILIALLRIIAPGRTSSI